MKELFKRSLKIFPWKKLYGGIGHILMFHSVLPASGAQRIVNNFLEVTPEHLERVIRFFMDRGYNILSLDGAVEYIKSGDYKSRFVVFTFDDGYLDNMTYAYPVFKKYNIPFTIYITTSFPDHQALIWWYPLEDVLRANSLIQFSFNGVDFIFSSKTIKEKEEAFIQIRSLIKQSSERDKAALYKAIFSPFGFDLQERTKSLVMNWDQIKTLSDDPLVTIGAHTVNHYSLSTLSLEDASREIIESVQIIQERIGKKVEHFSFPFGTKNDVGRREFNIARASGLITAVTTRPANIFPAHKDHLLSLPRYNIDMSCTERELSNIISGYSQLVTYRGKKVITE